MADWNLECEIKIRALETLKENLNKEIDELINITKKVQQEHLEVLEVQQNLNDVERCPLTITEFAKKSKCKLRHYLRKSTYWSNKS